MKMFLFLLPLLSLAVSARSVVPERIVTPPLELFSKFIKELPGGDMLVPVTTFSERGEFIRHGSKKRLSKLTSESFLTPSRAVVEMVPDQWSADSERKHRRGTAFHIGHNLLLTNSHVLDETFQNTTECADFQVKDHAGETYGCKTVHLCHPGHDVCLIEMAPKTKTKRSCLFCPGVKTELALAQGPALKLKASYRPSSEDWRTELLTAIGNSEGWGIHFSQGLGVSLTKDRTFFWAPITKGNSGGALLSSDGLVVGVVKLQTQSLLSSDPEEAYNVAAPSDLVIKLVREKLKDDPETLRKFNQAVIE